MSDLLSPKRGNGDEDGGVYDTQNHIDIHYRGSLRKLITLDQTWKNYGLCFGVTTENA